MILDSEQLLQSSIRIINAFDFDKTGVGIAPRRLPDWTRPQIPWPMELMVRMASGVRLAFTTNSNTIILRAKSTCRTFRGRPDPEVVFALACSGKRVLMTDPAPTKIVMQRLGSADHDIVQGKLAELTFTDLGNEEKELELWLPANAIVEIESVQLDYGASLETSPACGPVWVHYGSSISHGSNAEHPMATWPAVAASIAKHELWNLGFGGHCHLDQFVARTIRDLEPDFISIKVGINIANLDSMRERVFTPALHGFLDTIREGCPDTPILLISPIYMPGGETEPGPHFPGKDGRWRAFEGHEEVQAGCLTLERIRKIVAKVVEQRRSSGDKHIEYLDGLKLLDERDVSDLPDGLHPDTKGLRKMGERFAEQVFRG